MYRELDISEMQHSRNHYFEYPLNLIRSGPTRYNGKLFAKRLQERAPVLFAASSKARVKLLDYDDQTQSFYEQVVSDFTCLNEYLTERRDPKSRFIFLTAASNRSALNITHEMLLLLFSHHQVTPAFLDFLFCFTKRQFEQRFPFSGFRADRRLTQDAEISNFGPFGGSSQGFWMCYNLRAVESAPLEPEWKWSIRCTAIFQSFDFITGRATCIVVKANQEMVQRMRIHSCSRDQSDIYTTNTVSSSLAAAIEAHIVFIDWAAENGGWYIDHLEEEIENVTRRMSKGPVEAPSETTYQRHSAPLSVRQRTMTETSLGGISVLSDRTLPTGIYSREHPDMTGHDRLDLEGLKDMRFAVAERSIDITGEESNLVNQAHIRLYALQESQHLEEKSNDLVQTLESSVTVIEKLVCFYRETLASESCPEKFKGCAPSLEKLTRRSQDVVGELQAQIARVKALIHNLGQRKNLLSGIVEYCNMEASRILAKRSNESANNMAVMTGDMNKIALATKKETVSMKIITLVTLFFLPGTFISTLMSTDIVRWTNENGTGFQKQVSVGALRFYMAITVPLMAVTFTVWLISYWWASRQETMPRKSGAAKDER